MIKKVLTIFLATTSLGVAIESCKPFDIWIRDILFYARWESEQTNNYHTSGMFFYVDALPIGPSSTAALHVFNSCYATTLAEHWCNSLTLSSFAMSFDRQFTLDGNTIAAGTDIFRNNSIREALSITRYGVGYRIGFLQNLLQRIVFETGEYVVTFSCDTSDSLHFTKSYQVDFYI
jgi:hypothetical protein